MNFRFVGVNVWQFFVLALMTVCAFSSTLPVAIVEIEDEAAPEPATTSETEIRPLSCVQPNGVMPNWEDPTCKTYLICSDFILIELSCGEGEVYSLLNNACVDSELVNCGEQNQAVSITLRASAFLYNHAHNPSYSQPLDDEDGGGVLPLIDTSNVGKVLEGLTEERGRRVKRQVWTELGVPAIPEFVGSINIKLPDVICDFIHDEIATLVELVNAPLRQIAGCNDSDPNCQVPSLNLYCPEDESHEGEDDDDSDETDVEDGVPDNDEDDDDDDEIEVEDGGVVGNGLDTGLKNSTQDVSGFNLNDENNSTIADQVDIGGVDTVVSDDHNNETDVLG